MINGLKITHKNMYRKKRVCMCVYVYIFRNVKTNVTLKLYL